MRQGQQNRSRGRGRNRKSQNPLTRSFESNGPDIKIRGTPSHIAEKYVSLARDALSSGDPVLAESYLQHAEHYNRIIMTYREQQTTQSDQQQGGSQGRHREVADSDDEGHNLSDDGGTGHNDAVPRGHEPQPSLGDADAPAERQPQRRGGGSGDRQEPRRRRSSQRGQGNRAAAVGSGEQPSQQPSQGSQPPSDDLSAGKPVSRPAGGRSSDQEAGDIGQSERRPGRRDKFSQSDDQPEFLKRPIRKPRKAPAAAAPETSVEGGADAAEVKPESKVPDSSTA